MLFCTICMLLTEYRGTAIAFTHSILSGSVLGMVTTFSYQRLSRPVPLEVSVPQIPFLACLLKGQFAVELVLYLPENHERFIRNGWLCILNKSDSHTFHETCE